MSAKKTTTAFWVTIALFGITACETTEYDFDEVLDLDGLELVAEKGLDEVERDLNRDGGSLADAEIRPDSDESDEDDRIRKLRQEAIRFLRELASEEECALQGILSGRYRGGGLKLAGHWWSEDLAGVAKGIYEGVEGRRGGVFKARYRDMNRGRGSLGGKYTDPGVVHDIFGAFKGDWTPAQAEEAQGNIFGIWHPLYDKNDGVILGVWSSCNNRAVHRKEPVDVLVGDERD